YVTCSPCCTRPPSDLPAVPPRRSSDLASAQGSGLRCHRRKEGQRRVAELRRNDRKPSRANCAQTGQITSAKGEFPPVCAPFQARSEEHTSELQSRENLVCRLLPETKKE